MNPPILLHPEEDMMEKIFSILYRDENDYSANLVVFPGKRPSHYLRKMIAEKEKKPFIPPVIYSIEGLIDFIFERLFDWAKIQKIDAIAILYELCRNHPGIHNEFKKLDNFYSFGNSLFNSLEELYIENIPVEKLRSLETLIDIPQKSKDHIVFLSEIYEGFYKKLNQEALSSRSLRYRKVAEAEDYSALEPFKKIIFAGFFAFTESEKLFLKGLIRREKGSERLFFLFHDQEDINQVISSLGLEKALNSYREYQIKTPSLYSIPDVHGEIKIVGDMIKKIKDIDEKTVIVLPRQETLFPLLRQGLPYMEEDKYNISMGYSLVRTPIYGFFLNLFETSLSMDNELLYLPDYLKFMLHPYTKNIKLKGKAELNRILLHELEDYFKKDRLPPFMRLEEIEERATKKIYPEIEDVVSAEGLRPEDIQKQLKFIHDNTIRKVLSFKDIEEFVENCKELLLFIYKESTARLHPFFYPYMEVFIKELEKIANSQLSKYTFEKRESYFNFFKKVLSHCSVPFEGTPLKGLQILGFLETRNIKFKRVFFLDLNEGIFPDLSEDYLLPYRARKLLGLPTYQDRERLLYYYFKNLLYQAEESHLFYIKNDRIERSRFIEKLIWDLEKQGAEIGEATVNYKIDLSTKTPSEIKKTDEMVDNLMRLPLNASLLDDYLRCGLRFYYSAMLGLKKEKVLLIDPDRAAIGSLVHEIMNRFFRKRLNERITSINASSGELEQIIYSLFYDRYSVITGRLYLLRYQIIRKLKELLTYFENTFKEDEIISVEEDITGEINNTSIKGRLDLTLKNKGKLIRIIDYKTSSKPDRVKIDFKKLSPEDRSSWPKAIKSLQIPLYMMLYLKRYNKKIEDIEGYYLLVGRKSLDNKAKYSPFNSDKIEEFKIISNVINALIDEIKNPDIPFMPPEEVKDECPSCDYKTLCGTEWVKGYEF
ncbi:MAG: PD-(D/E)XK nuclease family protein [Thermodesulfovibrionales bacterium]